MTQVNRRRNSKSVRTTHPLLVQEWHKSKNSLTPDDIAAGGKHIIWWSGTCSHEWEASIRDRAIKEFGCPFCSNQRLLPGYNDFATTHPQVAQEWHPVNNTTTPQEVFAGTEKKAWWFRKECGHEWEASIRRRAAGSGCNVCLNRQLVRGVNDLQTAEPKIAEQWSSQNELLPSQVTRGHSKFVLWECDQGHSWKATPYERVKRQTGCPTCEGYQLLTGYNDLATNNPELAQQWHPTKNKLAPTEVGPGSHLNAFWICSYGHEWRTAVVHRAYSGTNCPVCTNRIIVKGFNDLSSQKPNLAKEWHPTKNDKNPDEVGIGFIYKAWWKCSQGHEWEASVCNRSKGQGCSSCQVSSTSKVEQAFRSYFDTYLKLDRTDHLARIPLPGYSRNVQIDILAITTKTKVIIEYDGAYYHKDKTALDLQKTKDFLAAGYVVIRIREKGIDQLQFDDPLFYQISYRWSLDQDKIAAAGQRVMKWLKDNELL